jgi:hypothetical protein
MMEQRTVTGFTKLNFKALGKVELTQADVEELIIDAEAEVCARIKTEVVDGTLVISYSSDWLDWLSTPLFGKDKLVFRIKMKEIQELTLAGPGNLTSSKITATSLKIVLDGPGVINLDNVTATDLQVEVSGVGSVDLNGKVTTQKVKLDGAGSYTGGKLESESTLVELSGVGNAVVWATTFLRAEISGAGAIEYNGHPKIEQRISGVGMLKSLSDN